MGEKYYGNYVGIVISEPSLDPEGRNRAQVWIPSLTNTLYKGWNDTQNDKDRSNLSVDMVNRLRNSLPWAECASPLIGGGTPFFSNSTTGIYDSDPAATVVNDDQNLDPEQEPIDPLPPVEMDLSMPLEDVPTGNQNLLIDEEPEDPLAVPSNENLTVDGPTFPNTPQNNAPGSGDKLPPVEPPLPEDGSVVVPSTPTVADQTGEPQAPAQSQPNPQIVNFQELKSFAKGTVRGRCIDDGSTGNCLQGASVWAYSLTKNEKLNRPTGGSAQDIRLGNNTFFQDSGSYQDNKRFPSNYQPQIGDQVLGKNHIITFLGRDFNGKELWYSDFADKSPSRYIQENGWNPNDMVLIRLKGAVDPAALASSETSTPSVPNDYADANSSVPYGGAGTATGTFSTINYLAKVWVFFYGGDIQRPVYFAQVTNPYSITEAYQADPESFERARRTV